MRLTTTGSPGGRDTPSHIWAKRIPVGAMHRPPSCSALATSKLRLSAQRNCRFRLTREPALRFTRANRPTTGGQRASALLTHSSCPIQSTFTEPSLPPSWREQLPERHASSVPGGRLSKHERTSSRRSTTSLGQYSRGKNPRRATIKRASDDHTNSMNSTSYFRTRHHQCHE